MPMKYVKLGDTGPEVSDICLGTMTWGSQMTDEAAAHAMMDAYVAAGGNFIDTAEMYPVPPDPEWLGTTELYIGSWLAKNPEVRKKVYIKSKVCGPSPRPFVSGARGQEPERLPNLDRESIRAACDGILKRLGTEYLDILYLHWPSRPAPLFGNAVYKASMEKAHPWFGDAPYTTVPLEESIKAMQELITEGKIHHWAISNETSFGVCSIVEICKRLGVPKPVCIQNDFSLVDRRFQYELAEACAPWNHNISGCPYGLLAGGTLSGKYLNGAKPENGRHTWKPDFQARYCSDRVLAACAKYADLAKSKGISPTVLALAWANQLFFNQSLIIGANSMEQLNECLSVVDVTLDEETLAKIDQIHSEDKNPNIVY
uniref:NADP-dependent oxidoreductase domain-containing protein n=1 Tax=Eutreptiella gymnastica TaxID=73025 RepID=A0A7S1HVV2_9EUGL|mmetsp:Transcript_108629/g.187918  ORF Transcript_108629/g.187918 Transcript_108629/m.187918 type:complete len:372 (+) Transcript_108629:256-1371(+)